MIFKSADDDGNAIDLPEQEILNAHLRAKEALLTEVATRTGLVMNPNVLTLGSTLLSAEEAIGIVDTFLGTPITEPRYLRRLAKIHRLERG